MVDLGVKVSGPNNAPNDGQFLGGRVGGFKRRNAAVKCLHVVHSS